MSIRIGEIAQRLAWSGVPLPLLRETMERRPYLRTQGSRGSPLWPEECIPLASIDAAELAGLTGDAVHKFLEQRGVVTVTANAICDFLLRRHGLKIGAADLILLLSRRGCAVESTAQPHPSVPAGDVDHQLLRELRDDVETLIGIGRDEERRAAFLAAVPFEHKRFRDLLFSESLDFSPSEDKRLREVWLPAILKKLNVAYDAAAVAITRVAFNRERARIHRAIRRLLRESPRTPPELENLIAVI